MTRMTITKPDTVQAIIEPPASKSISNRVLILNALSNSNYPIGNLSDSDDTMVLKKALESNVSDFDIGAAGTSMRFLTAYLAQLPGTWTITGSERMKNRPIRILVDALNQLGAKITYPGKEGFPPLKIEGKQLKGGTVALDGSVSSQYISALMMIAPLMEDGLTIKFTEEPTSVPYIQMTIALMRSFGVNVNWDGKQLSIPNQPYTPVPYEVEGDWSAASYWYELMSLAPAGSRIVMKGLHRPSAQGDAQGAILFRQLGVLSEETEAGNILLTKEKASPAIPFQYDFSDIPDLAQTFVVACCLGNIPFVFSGLNTLRIKETDRISALQNELKKLGYLLTDKNNVLSWNGEHCPAVDDPEIKTYEDHRMAMSFAMAAMPLGKITIADPQVVNKSYPAFWSDLKKAGFQLIE